MCHKKNNPIPPSHLEAPSNAKQQVGIFLSLSPREILAPFSFFLFLFKPTKQIHMNKLYAAQKRLVTFAGLFVASERQPFVIEMNPFGLSAAG